ncbi:MAG TPA: alpha-L-fucosidase, partial [Thermoguttaceae bacterium]|nr:alpha-L-fucosidase [Thermoguttaceae bacterium]
MHACRTALSVAMALVAPAALAADDSWYRSPRLAVMTGYIYEPKSDYTIREWEKGLGDKMDADRWVAGFKEAGASYLIFYDKWIDGFVFHDTKTTGFKTRRDFVREVADACHRGDLRLVYYYNSISDGNPEFDQWSLLDRRGEPIVFSPRWPTRYQTLHSPFRKASVEQLRELFTRYGRVDGIWLDIFGERLDTTSKWVAQGYEKMVGEPFDRASPERLAEFNARTLAGYLDEVRAIAREHQPECVWTSNGSARNLAGSPVWARQVGPRLDYLSVEAHRFDRMDQSARMAWVTPKPTEIGLLLCSSWFTPMDDAPPPASMTEKQAIAAAAVALCQGATVYMALAPGHSGVFGEDLDRAKAIGAWFQATEPVLTGARPYADVGIVLGSPAVDGPGLPARNTLWKWYDARQRTAWDEAFAVSDALARTGTFGQVLYDWPQGGAGSPLKRGATAGLPSSDLRANLCSTAGQASSGTQVTEGLLLHRAARPESLAGYRAILLPERAMLDEARADQIRRYVNQGGTLVAFGHASMLDASGVRREDYALGDVFGAKLEGEVVFPPKLLKTRVAVDSEYSAEYAAENLLDGRPTAWASGGTPMPHWAEITLPEPADVAKIELVSRPGPYLVADVDVEAHDGSAWKLVGSVRGAESRAISIALDKPVRTARIRVTILRELFQGEDRPYADVEAIRVVDTAGRDVSTNRAAPIPVVPAAPDMQQALAGAPVAILPMAVQVRPTTAEVIARLDDPSRSPAVLRNRFGRGQAILIATSEASFAPESPFWAALRRLTIGRPTLTCDRQAADRYRL